jgi:hypothetical protein
MHASRPAITRHDIERFRRRAVECSAEAEIEFNPVRKQERKETALAYERMAERGERFLERERLRTVFRSG